MFLKILTLATALVAAGLSGCNRDGPSSGNRIRVGFIGITCEAPIFAAVENGYFKEEGLQVELVKCEWSKYKDVLALGGYDITHHLIMYFLKPIEQGLDVKISAGIHTGCLRVQVPVDSPIKTVLDLKGKRIGVPGMGTPPFIFANRVLGDNGLNPMKDVSWRVYPAAELALALEKGVIDAIADSEPVGTLFLAQGKVRNLADQALDEPYAQEYCCAVIVNGKFLAKNPEKAAAATRALLKGAKWVETNPRTAARMAVEKKYLASNPELNTTAISNLRYIPSVKGSEESVYSSATAMKKAGMLAVGTDPVELAKKAFVHLEGVTDEWVEQLDVPKLADGQVPPDQHVRLAMELGMLGGPTMLYTCCGPPKRRP
jgi:NitT/TauT family transport system substrate-binding protein